MDLKILENTPPWEWPEDADQYFLEFLGDDQEIANAVYEALAMAEALDEIDDEDEDDEFLK